MTASFNPEQVDSFIRACARDIVMPYFEDPERMNVRYKKDKASSALTDADPLAEEFLRKRLAALTPGAFVVGEEDAEENPDSLDILKKPQASGWVIDPIDGTSNYANGKDTFCIMLAYVSGGQTQMAWIYDPVRDVMAFARRGQGAFINGKRMQVNAQPDTIRGFAHRRTNMPVQDVSFDTLRCVGIEYIRIVQGHASFAVYDHMKPWDHLPGALLVEEAGGIVRQWDHTPYTPADGTGGILVAVNEPLWQKVRATIPQKTLEKNGLSL